MSDKCYLCTCPIDETETCYLFEPPDRCETVKLCALCYKNNPYFNCCPVCGHTWSKRARH